MRKTTLSSIKVVIFIFVIFIIYKFINKEYEFNSILFFKPAPSALGIRQNTENSHLDIKQNKILQQLPKKKTRSKQLYQDIKTNDTKNCIQIAQKTFDSYLFAIQQANIKNNWEPFNQLQLSVKENSKYYCAPSGRRLYPLQMVIRNMPMELFKNMLSKGYPFSDLLIHSAATDLKKLHILVQYGYAIKDNYQFDLTRKISTRYGTEGIDYLASLGFNFGNQKYNGKETNIITEILINDSYFLGNNIDIYNKLINHGSIPNCERINELPKENQQIVNSLLTEANLDYLCRPTIQ